jgi:hypothetical protein
MFYTNSKAGCWTKEIFVGKKLHALKLDLLVQITLRNLIQKKHGDSCKQ